MWRIIGSNIAEIQCTSHARTHRASGISARHNMIIVNIHFRCGWCSGSCAHRKIRQVRLMIREADVRMIGRQRCDWCHRSDRRRTAYL